KRLFTGFQVWCYLSLLHSYQNYVHQTLIIMKQHTTPVFIDPTTDFGFNRIFGTEANKDLLISFLNALFRGRKLIEDLYYNKNKPVGETEEVGTVIFDLTCTASDGERFIIEVQRTPQTNLKKRMLYYGSKLIADQAPKGN